MIRAPHLRFWLVSLALLCLFLWLLSDVLTPFVAGIAIAYVLDPWADRLERVGAPRWLATTLVLLVFLVILVAALMLLVPIISAQVADLIDALPTYLEALGRYVRSTLRLLRSQLPPNELERLGSSVGEYAGDAVLWLVSVLGGLFRGGMALINIVSLLVITPIVAFYLLRDWDRLVARIDANLPRPSADTIRGLAVEVNRTLNGFLRGQGAVCLILGVFYAVALTVAGLNFGLLVGLIAGLISFIPYVGSITGLLLSTGIAMVQFDSWGRVAVILGIFLFGQVVEGNVLTPRLVGGSVNLHPVIVIFALLAGGSLFGFTGVMLAVPVAAIIGVVARFGLRVYRDSPYYRGEARLITPDEPLRLRDTRGP